MANMESKSGMEGAELEVNDLSESDMLLLIASCGHRCSAAASLLIVVCGHQRQIVGHRPNLLGQPQVEYKASFRSDDPNHLCSS